MAIRQPSLLTYQGKKLSVQCRNCPGKAETLRAVRLTCQRPFPGALLYLPAPKTCSRDDEAGPPRVPDAGDGIGEMAAGREGTNACGGVSLPEGPRAGAKLGLDIDIESWLFERHNSLCLLQS